MLPATEYERDDLGSMAMMTTEIKVNPNDHHK